MTSCRTFIADPLWKARVLCAIELAHAFTFPLAIKVVGLDTNAYSHNFYEFILAATLPSKNKPVGGCWAYGASKIITYTVRWAFHAKLAIAVIGC